MEGIVIKKIANNFTVDLCDQIVSCVPRGKLKSGGVFVGDRVIISKENEVCSIEAIKERKNCLVRPPVANIDQMLIVVAVIPKPDFMLIDKLILLCSIKKIEPILCINKNDISSEEFISEIKRQYHNVLRIVDVSAKTKGHGLKCLINLCQIRDMSK